MALGSKQRAETVENDEKNFSKDDCRVILSRNFSKYFMSCMYNLRFVVL